jgi:hypothetical protein
MDEALRQKLETRVARLEQQIRAFKELHASELGIILEELGALRNELMALKTSPADAPAHTADPRDPAAGSPKRAAWLAEQERKERERQEPLSRRELLRGRGREGSED